jgi:ADP-heptose:LPS heptosyltransferase
MLRRLALAENRRALNEAHKALRRELRQISGQLLRRVFHPRRFTEKLAPADIRSVLICRLNGRLGNTLLITPLIRRLHELIPHAAIDLALAYPKASDLLGPLPGVRRVIQFPHKEPGLLWRYPAALRALRADSYDLAIDPVPESSSGRVALSLCRARHRLGFDTETQWVGLTHPVPRPAADLHHGIEPVYLLSQAFELSEKESALESRSLPLWLPLEPHELAAGRAAVWGAVSGALRGSNAAAEGRRLIGFFAHASGLKKLGAPWWREFWGEFLRVEPAVIPVEFLPAVDSPRTHEDFPALHIPSLRALAAAISATDLFIAPDTGPMHLASATSAPTIALFCASDLTRYRPLKGCDLAIDVRRSSAREVAARCHDARRADAPAVASWMS